MFVSPKTIVVALLFGLLGASCGGGNTKPDAGGGDDAANPDAAIDAAIDAKPIDAQPSFGLTAIFHMVDLVQSDLDTVVNKLLVAEAKAMGASKVDLKGASTTPRHGIFALAGGILAPTMSSAMGVAVK